MSGLKRFPADKFPYFTDKRVTDMFLLLTDKFPHAPKVFFLSLPYPIKPSFRKKRATISKIKDAEKFSVFFLVEQIINLSNQFTNDFARVIDFSYEISAL